MATIDLGNGESLVIKNISDTDAVTQLQDTDNVLIGSGVPAKHISWSNMKAPLIALVQQNIIGSITSTSQTPTGTETAGQAYGLSDAIIQAAASADVTLGGTFGTVPQGTEAGWLRKQSNGTWKLEPIKVDLSGYAVSGGSTKTLADVDAAVQDIINNETITAVTDYSLTSSGGYYNLGGSFSTSTSWKCLALYEVAAGDVYEISYLFTQGSMPYPASKIIFFPDSAPTTGQYLSSELTTSPQAVFNQQVTIPAAGKLTFATRIDATTNPNNGLFVFNKMSQKFITPEQANEKYLTNESIDNLSTGEQGLAAAAPIVKSLTNTLTAAIPITIQSGYYIKAADGTLNANTSYKIAGPYKITDYINPLVDVGNFGGSIAPLSYFSGNPTDGLTYIGHQITTVGGSDPTTGQQLTKVVLQIPTGATYFYICSHINFSIALYGVKTPLFSISADMVSPIVGSDVYEGQDNPFESLNTQAKLLYQRGGFLSNIPDGYMPLILLCGQSNTDGRIVEANLPTGILESDYSLPGYMMWNRTAGQFQTYKLGVNTGSYTNTDTRFAYDIFFAKKFLTDHPTLKLYCIKQSAGGVPITEKGTISGSTNAERWQPKTELIASGENSMCLELITKVKAAKAFAAAQGLKLFPIAILYHQGEGDADRVSSSGVTDYPTNLSNLISWFRGLFGTPTLPFLNGEINYTYAAAYPQINSVFGQLNALDPFMLTVNMSAHQTTIGDGLHYDAAAAQYMGETMYSNWRSLNSYI